METETVKTKKPRPSAFVDLKWIFGILFTISFGLTIFFYNLSFLIQKENLAKITRPIVQQLLIPNGLPADQYQAILEYAQMFPDASLSIPETPFQFEIKGSEVLNLKKEEFESLLIDNLIKKIQDGKINQIFTSISAPSIFGTLATLMSSRFESIVKTVMRINLFFSLLWFIPFFIFSHRFGKIASLGVSFLAVSFPMVISNIPGKIALSVFLKESPAVDPALRFDLLLIYNTVYKNYWYLFLLGLVLVVVALVFSIVLRFRKKSIPKSANYPQPRA